MGAGPRGRAEWSRLEGRRVVRGGRGEEGRGREGSGFGRARELRSERDHSLQVRKQTYSENA
eukprot:6799429-Pyramimonas_sp.AAC.1